MNTWSKTLFPLTLVAGLVLFGLPGCASKSVQSEGETATVTPPPAKGPQGVNPNFPDTSLANKDASTGLRGLDRTPSEERVPGSGSMVAKMDPSQGSRQTEDIRSEQIATAAAGLRDAFFAYDSFAITDDGRDALVKDAEWARANPNAKLKIEGHCDERGTSAYNIVLGEKRAKAVRNYLVELGINANRVSVVSYGKERPFCSEHTETCYAQNRRGHVVVRTDK